MENYSAMETAEYIIDKCLKDGYAISNLQLQCILYYVQKEFLDCKTEAFSDDFEAWNVGPAIPAVYNQYSSFGGMPIRLHYDVALDEDHRDIIDNVIAHKETLRQWEMAEDIMRKDGMWDKVFRNGKGDHQVIPKEDINGGKLSIGHRSTAPPHKGARLAE